MSINDNWNNIINQGYTFRLFYRKVNPNSINLVKFARKNIEEIICVDIDGNILKKKHVEYHVYQYQAPNYKIMHGLMKFILKHFKCVESVSIQDDFVTVTIIKNYTPQRISAKINAKTPKINIPDIIKFAENIIYDYIDDPIFTILEKNFKKTGYV